MKCDAAIAEASKSKWKAGQDPDGEVEKKFTEATQALKGFNEALFDR
jgi:hypothetical protein